MGMFDYVNFKMPCPQCGEVVGDWQSKSGACTMSTVDPKSVGYFYSDCVKCKLWFDFSRDEPVVPARAEPYNRAEVEAMGFTLSTRPSGQR